MRKTNAMRLLEKAGIPYEAKEYEYDENDLSGVTAADKLGLSPDQVFKTLVLRGGKDAVFIFLLPVNAALDLKAAAAAAGEKKAEMVHVRELLPLTGYIRGGCSPIGMKKKYPAFIHDSVLAQDKISISAGVRGCQIMISPKDLIPFIEAKTFH